MLQAQHRQHLRTRKSPGPHCYNPQTFVNFSSDWTSDSTHTWANRTLPKRAAQLAPSPIFMPTIAPLRYPRKKLTRLQKARLRHWLIRNCNGANLLRSIIFEADPLLASQLDLENQLLRGIHLLRDLRLNGPPLYKLYRLPRLFTPPLPAPLKPPPQPKPPSDIFTYLNTEWSPPANELTAPDDRRTPLNKARGRGARRRKSALPSFHDAVEPPPNHWRHLLVAMVVCIVMPRAAWHWIVRLP